MFQLIDVREDLHNESNRDTVKEKMQQKENKRNKIALNSAELKIAQISTGYLRRVTTNALHKQTQFMTS